MRVIALLYDRCVTCIDAKWELSPGQSDFILTDESLDHLIERVDLCKSRTMIVRKRRTTERGSSLSQNSIFLIFTLIQI